MLVTLNGTRESGEVGEFLVVVCSYGLSEGWCVDHEGAVAEGDAYVVDVVGGSEEDEVSGLGWCSWWEEGAGVVLGLRGARDG